MKTSAPTVVPLLRKTGLSFRMEILYVRGAGKILTRNFTMTIATDPAQAGPLNGKLDLLRNADVMPWKGIL